MKKHLIEYRHVAATIVAVIVCFLLPSINAAEPEFFHVYQGKRLPFELDETQLAVQLTSHIATKARPSDAVARALTARLNHLGFRPEHGNAYRSNGWLLVSATDGLRSIPSQIAPRKQRLQALAARIADDADVEFVAPVFRDDRGQPISFEPTLLIGFKDDATDVQKSAVWLRVGATRDKKSVGRKERWFVKSTEKNGIALLDKANEIAEMPGVLFAEPDFIFQGRPAISVNVGSWGLKTRLKPAIGAMGDWPVST